MFVVEKKTSKVNFVSILIKKKEKKNCNVPPLENTKTGKELRAKTLIKTCK